MGGEQSSTAGMEKQLFQMKMTAKNLEVRGALLRVVAVCSCSVRIRAWLVNDPHLVPLTPLLLSPQRESKKMDKKVDESNAKALKVAQKSGDMVRCERVLVRNALAAVNTPPPAPVLRRRRLTLSLRLRSAIKTSRSSTSASARASRRSRGASRAQSV